MDFDLPETLARGARQAWSAMADKGLDLSFDCHGPTVRIKGDPTQTLCGLHRLFCGMVDMLRSGLVMFDARYTLDEHGRCQITIDVAGAGPLVEPEQVTQVLERLKMTENLVTDGQHGLREASGVCPNTGAVLTYSGLPGDGALLRSELQADVALAEPDADAVDAKGARAWVVNAPGFQAQLWMRRLQRRGWAVTIHDTSADAMAALSANPQAWRPALVLVYERSDQTMADAQALAAQLPDWAQVVLTVRPASLSLGRLGEVSNVEINVFPISNGDLARFTERASEAVGHPSGQTRPAPLHPVDRRRILIVDDTPVNLIVGKGLVEAVGYDAVTVNSGLHAIELCKRSPPHAVLMDIHMPEVDGLEATRRLRLLQRQGEVAPFPIVATTAADVPRIQSLCHEAGMDGFVPKPIVVAALQQELRRVLSLS